MPSATVLCEGDPMEGMPPEGDLDWWRAQAAGAKSAAQRQVIENNRRLLSAFAAAFHPNYYVSCWHMNALESIKMWDVYTKSPDSVAITTTYSLLRGELPSYVDVGVVRYTDYASERLPSMNMFEYITHKRIAYCFEREVRAVAFPPATDGLGLQSFQDNLFAMTGEEESLFFAPEVDVTRLIQSVVLHSDATTDFAKTVRGICKDAGLPAPVTSKVGAGGTAAIR